MAEISSLRPIAAILVSAIAIGLILASHRYPNVREGWTLVASAGKLAVIASLVPGVLAGDVYVAELPSFIPGVPFALKADPLGVVFALLASLLWLFTSFYSIGYMRGLSEHSQTRYFAAFAGSVSAAVGVAFASNLLVLFVFYELLTIATYPLVAHAETEKARAAGRKYLAYTLGGGVAVLGGTVLIYWLTGTGDTSTVTFATGGIESLAIVAEDEPIAARIGFLLLIAGFGVKASLMPLHSWLPDAMVAPTPVSGLLHAVAVVKSGVFGIARVVLDIYGPDLVSDIGGAIPLAVVASITILTASIMAIRQDNLKRRLAYSTISQLSYIVLGLGVGAYVGMQTGNATNLALIGGLLHIPAHAFMKLTLFFCAGAIHVETHTDDISDMAGIGKRMPLTMTAFAIAAAGMAGMPLLAGFVSKWYLLLGSLNGGVAIFAAVLLVSGMLNVIYFWPVVYQAFFQTEGVHDPKPIIQYPVGAGPVSSLPEPLGRSGAVAAAAIDGHEGAASGEAHGDQVERIDEETTIEGTGEHHQAGPPPGGWPRRAIGAESTWFMLAPILVVVGGAVVLGILPHEAVFLRLIELVVENARPSTLIGLVVG